MLGALIGIICGGAELFVLLRFTHVITCGGRGKVLYTVLFMLIPQVSLIAVALLFPTQLLTAGIGMTATLVPGTFTCFIIHMIREKNKNKGSDCK